MAATSASHDAAGVGITAAATVAAGSHVLEVEGYSKTKAAFRVGESIESGEFQVGGHSWLFRFYPSGEDVGDAGWVVVFLRFDCTACACWNQEIKAWFSFALLSGHDGERADESMMTRQHTFDRWKHRRTGGKFVETKLLESPRYLVRDHYRRMDR